MLVNKPPMGWNSWNTFGENIDEALIMETADVMVNDGYKDAGYEYVIIDDCWSLRQRDENGRLLADPEKFPHGIKYLADYIHSKGLKFGMYSDCGFRTCANYPGSWGHEYIDAKTFAEWDVDYLKYDFGNRPESADVKVSYLTMAQALRHCGRNIVLASCNWGVEEPWKWMRSRGAHTYRSTHDISDKPESFIEIFRQQFDKFENSCFDCYNDLDMLTVGMNGKGNVAQGGCTTEEYLMHFVMWAYFGSPLIIGADVRNIDDNGKNILLNREIISINQDPENRPPFRCRNYYDHGYGFCKLLANDEVALLAVNLHPEGDHPISFAFDDLGIPSNRGLGLEVTDIVTGEKLGIMQGGFAEKIPNKSFKLYRAKLADIK